MLDFDCRKIQFKQENGFNKGACRIGAIFVGGIQMQWMTEPFNSKEVIKQSHDIFLKKDEELGTFKYGSTIILLFEKNHLRWNSSGQKNKEILVGSALATIISPPVTD